MLPITDFTVAGWEDFVQGKSVLELGNMGLTDENIVGLASVLKNNATIRKIDLRQNKITVVGATLFADALRINRYIASNPVADTHALKFTGNSIGKDGLFALVKAFDETGRMMHCLLLGNIGVTDEEAEELSKTPEVIRVCEATKEFQNALHPDGDCVLF